LSYHIRGFNLGSYLALRDNNSDGFYARLVHVGDVDLTPFLVQWTEIAYGCDKELGATIRSHQAMLESGHDGCLGTSKTYRPSFDSEATFGPCQYEINDHYASAIVDGFQQLLQAHPDYLRHGFDLPYFFVFELPSSVTKHNLTFSTDCHVIRPLTCSIRNRYSYVGPY